MSWQLTSLPDNVSYLILLFSQHQKSCWSMLLNILIRGIFEIIKATRRYFASNVRSWEVISLSDILESDSFVSETPDVIGEDLAYIFTGMFYLEVEIVVPDKVI